MNYRSDGMASLLRALIARYGFARFFANRSSILAVLATLALALNTNTANAQSNAVGGVFGRVTGVAAADLGGATATISSKETNIARSTDVSSSGTFEFANLPVGDYTVTLAIKGREAMSQDTHISLATTNSVRFEGSGVVQMEKFEVHGGGMTPVNVSDPEINFNIRAETVKELPVAQNLTAVAMLAAGVTKGDTGYFGELTSMAGASVAENAYYLNGFNITDFRRGLGYGTVPFEFFQEFQVKQFGYSAEFGRSTGGVVNAASKRGSNEYKAKANIYWTPAGLRSSAPDSYRRTGTLFIVNSIGSSDSKVYNVEFSGPIWKNHIYLYGLFQGRDTKDDFINGTNQWWFRKSTSPFWAGKLDYQINEDHSLEYTVFSDKADRLTHRYSYPLTSSNFSFTRPAALGASAGDITNNFGGTNHIGRYSGTFFKNLNLSAMYGNSLKNSTQASAVANKPYVVDNRSSSVLGGSSSETEDMDRRRAYRFDGSFKFDFMGSHNLKFGYDLENNTAHSVAKPSGDYRYIIDSYTAGTPLANGAIAPAGTTAVVSRDKYFVGGDFRVITEAMYAEDEWRLMSDRLNLRLGVRNESFDNRNGNDKTFIKLKNQLAPRLAFAYDLDGQSKVSGGWGRYFLQIPANTNVRLAGGETYYSDFFVLGSSTLDANGAPGLGAQIGNRLVTGNGIVPDVSTIVNAQIGPMYQDEFVLGYERSLGKKWKMSVKGIYRNLAQVIEDEAVDKALNTYAAAHGFNSFEAGGFDYYVLTNPGAGLDFYVNLDQDSNHDGVVDYADQGSDVTKEHVVIPGKDLGYPPATRYYYAVALELERALSDKWMANFSYTWMHSYGNYEGSVYSDIGQSDAGITQLFDQPGLVDGTYGNQPNDRRHTFKAFGVYKLTKEISVSAVASLQSGRPISGLGLHPTDLFARAYRNSSYYVRGVLTPRGSFGRTPWLKTLDLAIKYKPTWAKEKLTFGMDVFNPFNWRTVTGVYERAETSTGSYPEPRFLMARTYQTPRYFRFSAEYSY